MTETFFITCKCSGNGNHRSGLANVEWKASVIDAIRQISMPILIEIETMSPIFSGIKGNLVILRGS
jgi:hypothetical protein